MTVRSALLALALLLPLSGAAQQLAPVVPGTTEPRLVERLLALEPVAEATVAGQQVVPLWASADGRLLAIVAMAPGNGAPALPPSPAFGGSADLRIIDAADLFATGLRWRVGGNVHADALLGRLAAPGPGAICMRASGCGDGAALQGLSSLFGAGVGLGWHSASGTVDLSYGLSWLERGGSRDPFGMPTLFDGALSPLDPNGPAGVLPLQFESGLRMQAHGNWHVLAGTTLDLTAGWARSRYAPLWTAPAAGGIDLSQAYLGFGIRSGSLRGSVVGHVVGLDDPALPGARRWSALDLGVSWRTPWRGEVSVGAQNLWTAPLDGNGASAEADAAQARTPYVQYRQDL